MPVKIDLVGQQFGKLTVINKSYKRLYNRISWVCLCSCGKEKIATGNDLKMGKVSTCGNSSCIIYNTKPAHDAKITHGMSRSRLYRIFRGIQQRCHNPRATKYRIYGGRGITICDEWNNDFIGFKNWSINNGYTNNLTIDRINNDGNYEPDNCQWSTRKEQSRNKSSNRQITYKNKTLCVNEWAEIKNINNRTLIDRLNHDWSISDALNRPPQQGVKYAK
jgi:hypothetical protein